MDDTLGALGDLITAARDALARGDARAALVNLLAAWRATPAPALAEAVEAVGIVAARELHAPGGTDAADREERWVAEARRGDPVMRQRLLETIADTSPAAAKVARAKVLAETETDPRTAMAIAKLASARSMPWYEQYRAVWTPLFEMLASAGDPRVLGDFDATPWDDVVRGTPKQKAAFRVRLSKYRDRLAQVFANGAPQLAVEDGAIVDEIIALARRPVASDEAHRAMAAELLAAVYAAPGESGPRAIYADWLQQHGDPRGELIALQLAYPAKVPPEIATRTRQLLAQHRATWTGELDRYLSSETYRGGFLEEATLARPRYDAPYVDAPPHPAWATVRAIRGGVPANDACPMPILATAREIDHRGLRVLARLANPPPLEMLGFVATDPHHDALAVADFATIVRRVPTLRHFAIEGEGAERLAWAWRGSAVRVLDVAAPIERLRFWITQIDALDEISVSHRNWRTSFTRAGTFTARQARSGDFADVFPQLEAVLEAIAPQVSELVITVGAKSEWRVAERRRMDELLVRHPTWKAKIYGYTTGVHRWS